MSNAPRIDEIESRVQGLDSLTDKVELPLIDVPFTTITNRAKMADLSNDLKPRFGTDRVQIQQIVPCSGEYGPNKEAVYKPINDIFNQVRFYGDVSDSFGTNGSGITLDVGAVMEITFYGTGLNILSLTDTATTREADIYFNGVLETSDFIPATSSVINTRNYSPNMVINGVKGKTLGLHTVRIHMNSTNARTFFGFETLNEDSNIVVNPGTATKAGKKLELTTQTTTPYNSSFESEAGTDNGAGGHVSIYLKEDGTVGKSVQWASGSQANFGAADHSDEEVISTHFWREFGAARSDDYSLLQAAAPAAFTLDDGTTTLGSNDANATTIVNNLEIFQPTGNGDYTKFTFVGTGIDILHSQSDDIDPHDVSIDGVSIGNMPTTGAGVYTSKIVSGLPYGTHTLTIQRNAFVINPFRINKILVYGPKTPTVPDNAVSLGDYFLVADWVANTVQSSNSASAGVIRKVGAREFLYTNGTGGTQDWAITSIIPTSVAFTQLNTDRLNSSVECTFFGTGFDFRFDASTNRSNDISVTANGTALTAANFPTANFSTYGTGVAYNDTTGTLDQLTGSGLAGCGFVCSDLPLNTYTIKFNNNVASSFLVISSIDIITPVHSPKLNGPIVKQNTLRVGSQAIRDLRNTVDTIEYSSDARGLVSAATTSSTAFIPVDYEMTTFYAPIDGLYTVSYHMSVELSNTTNNISSILLVDGIVDGDSEGQIEPGVASRRDTLTVNKSIYLTKGEHYLQIQFAVGGGILTLPGTERYLQITKQI